MKANCWYDSVFWTPLPGQLENGTWTNFNPIPFLKIRISIYLFKREADGMSKQFSGMIQSLTSIIALITLSWIMKAMHVALLPYLALKAPFTITISMYYIIYQSDTYTDSSVHRQQSRTWYCKTSVYSLFLVMQKKERRDNIIGLTNYYLSPINQLLTDFRLR